MFRNAPPLASGCQRGFSVFGGFQRVTGAGLDRLAELQTLAIVHSGRHGIAPDVAPARVLEILERAGLPPTWLSPPSGVNYALGLREGTGARRIGVVHLGQGVGDGRLLEE